MTAYTFEHLYDTGAIPLGRFYLIDFDTPEARHLEETRMHMENHRFQERMDAALKKRDRPWIADKRAKLWRMRR